MQSSQQGTLLWNRSSHRTGGPGNCQAAEADLRSPVKPSGFSSIPRPERQLSKSRTQRKPMRIFKELSQESCCVIQSSMSKKSVCGNRHISRWATTAQLVTEEEKRHLRSNQRDRVYRKAPCHGKACFWQIMTARSGRGQRPPRA